MGLLDMVVALLRGNHHPNHCSSPTTTAQPFQAMAVKARKEQERSTPMVTFRRESNALMKTKTRVPL
jgi:hypothetical protein